MTDTNVKTYTRKSDANRGAKRAHGDNWAELYQVVAVEGGFAIEAKKVESAPEPVKETKAAAKPAAKKPAAKAPAKVKAEPAKETVAAIAEQVVAKELAEADKPTMAPVEAAPAPVAEQKAPAVADLVAELKASTQALQTGLKAPAKALMPVASKPAAQTPAKAAAPVEKKKGGRPISDDQIKARRRLEDWVNKQTGKFTVKEATKALKIKKMHISNAMRWLEQNNKVDRVEYKIEKRQGRRELYFKAAGVVLPTDQKKAA